MTISIAALLTVVAGFLLYGRLGYRLDDVTGVLLFIGGLSGLVSLIYGGAITAPTTMKMGKIGAEIQASGKPPTAEQMAQIQQLQARLRQAGLINAVLVSVAVILMAVARYL